MIGIFDSGSGGLSVLREVLKLLPGEKFVYYADNANCPYGEKTPEFIQSRCRANTEYLLSRGARIIVVACNTATAAAITTLRNEYPVKFIGMEPAEDNMQVIEAEVPISEMNSYAIDLRSMTQGRGSFSCKFVRYEEAPGNVQQKVIEEAKKEQEA